MTEHVYQLEVPIPYDFGTINCYLIKGEKGFTIVDTGAYTEEAIALWSQALTGIDRVEKVILTHNHPDHVGLAGWFQKQFHARVFMADKGYEELLKMRPLFKDRTYSNPFSILYSLHGGPVIIEQENRYHKPEAYQFEPDELFQENQQLELGDCLYEAISTPGHSPDHFCFYDQENQVLLVGDHILNSINPIVLSQKQGDNPLEGYIQSLNKIKNLPVKHVLPGHGEPIDDLPARLLKMRLHYQKRWEQIYHSLQHNEKNAYQVSQDIYGNDLPQDRAMSAFVQMITNLTYLESIGRIKMRERYGKIYYYRESNSHLKENNI